MTDEVVIRPVTSEDELAELARVLAAQFPPRRSERTLPRLDRPLQLAALRDGVIVGGALATTEDGAMKIEVIAMAPDARGKGAGLRLMAALEAEAMRRGIGRVYLGGANDGNRGFYRRLGYSGRRSLMQKSLPRSRSGGQ